MNLDPRSLSPALLLAVLLAIAVASDIRSRRIPNRVVGFGMLAGLVLHATVTPGSGLFSVPFGGQGFLHALGGLLLGLLLLLPMYALGTMAAGDVKLMAMVGAFVGPADILGATLSTLLAGGALALLFATLDGSLRKVLGNVRDILLGSVLRALSGGSARVESTLGATGKMPYAVAIASGTVAYLLLTRVAGWTV